MEIIYETLFTYIIIFFVLICLNFLAIVGLYAVENPYAIWEKIQDFINLITKPINF